MPESDDCMPPSARNVVSQKETGSAPVRIGFLLIDGFALMSYASVAEPFRAANALSGRQLYQWQHISTKGTTVRASNGAQLQVDISIADEMELDLLFVCAAGNPAGFKDPATLNWLRFIASRGVRIGGVSGGPYILARAGLLKDYRCTIHWEHRPAFAEAFPTIYLQQGLYVIDRDRLTCAGGTAGLDLAIELISADHGPILASMVGDWYLRTQPRDAGATQRMSLRERYNVNNESVLSAIALMEANCEEPLSRTTLAQKSGVSVRQLERLFSNQLNSSIGSLYLNIRLIRAMSLLKETSLRTMDVAIACGFASTSHFSRAFKRQYNAPPSAFRSLASPTAVQKDGKRRYD